jgi:hypothetical protein
VAGSLTLRPAQTEVKDTSDVPSASNFLEREKAVLGDDATQFATVEDAEFDDGDDDLLGGGGGVSSPGNNAAFESQFPDLSGPNEVWDNINSSKTGTFF